MSLAVLLRRCLAPLMTVTTNLGQACYAIKDAADISGTSSHHYGDTANAICRLRREERKGKLAWFKLLPNKMICIVGRQNDMLPLLYLTMAVEPIIKLNTMDKVRIYGCT